MKKHRTRKVKIDTFVKAIVVIAVAHGMILVTTSYVLSFFGYDPVIDLSVVIVKEIVAPIITYLAVNTIMNIFEKNCFTFCQPREFFGARNGYSDYTYGMNYGMNDLGGYSNEDIVG